MGLDSMHESQNPSVLIVAKFTYEIPIFDTAIINMNDWVKTGIKFAVCSASSFAVGYFVAKRLTACNKAGDNNKPKLVGGVIRLRPEKAREYIKLHANVWPKVLDTLYARNIRNFTIYHCPQLDLLFSHFEYIGDNLEKDSALMGENAITRDWWKECEPCQKPLQWTGPPPSERGSGMSAGDQWWASLTPVFHDGHYASQFA